MKIAGAALERQQVGQWVRLAGFAGAGFLAAGCCLDGRAPLAAGLLAIAGTMAGVSWVAAACGALALIVPGFVVWRQG